MNDDYLWDRSGPPDPDVERLEQALAPLRYRHRADLLRQLRNLIDGQAGSEGESATLSK